MRNWIEVNDLADVMHINYESANLRALCPLALVAYALSCPHSSCPACSCALCALCTICSHSLRTSCPMCSHALRALYPTYCRAPSDLCLACSRASRALCPTYLVLYVLSCLTHFVLHMPRAL